MSDIDDLTQKLAALAGGGDQYENGARVIAQGGVPSGMTALVQAVEDTVLERHLEIMTGSHLVTLVAAGRRLRGIAQVVPAKGGSAKLVGKPLSRDDAKGLDAAYALLSDLLNPAARLTLRSLPAAPFGQSGERGVTAAELSEFWQIDLNETPPPPMERFLLINETTFSAYLHIEGSEILSSDGDIAALQTVWQDQVEDFLATRAILPGHADGPQFLTLDGALGVERAVAIGLAGDEIALMIYEPGSEGVLHASWQAIFA